MSVSGKGDAEKARYWQRTISEAARSGISIRQFCRQRRLRESQFYSRNYQAGTSTAEDGFTGRIRSIGGSTSSGQVGERERRGGRAGNRPALPW
jgi:hypothetical protein